MSEIIFIILPVHNRSRVTAGFIDSLLAQSDPNYRLLLVDDGCTDNTVGMVAARVPDVTVIHGDGKLWWAASVQLGIDWLVEHAVSTDSIVLIANDDTSFGSELMANARAYLGANPGVMLQAVPVDPATEQVLDRGISIDWLRFRMGPAMPGAEIDCLATRCLFSRLTDIMVAGGFRPRLLPHYFSDYEFTIRAKRRGIRLAVADDVRIFASRETTGTRSTQSMTWEQYVRVAFSKRHSFNPLYFSVFVLLAAPARHQPLSLLRVWAGFFVGLLRSAWFSVISAKSGTRH